MAKMVILDTNLAQRDVNRVTSAINSLREIEVEYTKLMQDIEANYKGPAAAELIEVIRSRITSQQYGTQKMQADLQASKNTISHAIKVFKSYDDNMLNLIK